MKRREFLASCGCIGTAPLLVHAGTTSRRPLEIRYWFSPGAAQYQIHGKVRGYLQRALQPVFSPLQISYGGVAPVNNEHGYYVTSDGEWPMKVMLGYGSRGGVEPARDVNLLITDGPLRPDPPGVARRTKASIGGARRMAEAPPCEEIGEYEPYRGPLYAMQILIHEVGHVLGLAHEHGSITRLEDGVAASPMVSGYAWTPRAQNFSDDVSHCGDPYPEDRYGIRYLSMDFSTCARSALRDYRTPVRPN